MYSYKVTETAVEIESNIEALQASLAEGLISSGYKLDHEKITQLSQQSFVLQGQLQAVKDADAFLFALPNNNKAKMKAILHITERLCQSNDTWSGRGNDSVRAVADGYREAARRIITALEDDILDAL